MGVLLIWPYKYKDIDNWRQEKVPESQSLLCEHPIHSIVITKNICPLNNYQKEQPSLLGVPFMSNGLLNEHKICL